MADGGDDWRLARAHGTHEAFIVKAPEVFHRASATTNDNQVDAGDLVGLLESVDDRAGAGLALDARGYEPRGTAPPTGLEHLDEVMPDRTDFRGHESDDFGEIRERALEFILE